MSCAETLLPEFDHEMANTHQVLECIPDDKLDREPHPEFHTIGWNANHLANIPDWLVHAPRTPEVDIAPVGGEPYNSPEATNGRQILEMFDRNVATAREAITRAR